MPTFEIEFDDGRRFPLADETDAEIARAVKAAGLWRPGEYYPDFTMYRDGEETGGGGGSNSGRMESAPPDLSDVLAALAAGKFKPLNKADRDVFAGASDNALIYASDSDEWVFILDFDESGIELQALGASLNSYHLEGLEWRQL